MADINREKFNKLADKIDALDNNEQRFILWYLLGGLIEQNQKELETPKHIDVSQMKPYEVAYDFYCREKNRILPTVRDEIYEQIMW